MQVNALRTGIRADEEPDLTVFFGEILNHGLLLHVRHVTCKGTYGVLVLDLEILHDSVPEHLDGCNPLREDYISLVPGTAGPLQLFERVVQFEVFAVLI